MLGRGAKICRANGTLQSLSAVAKQAKFEASADMRFNVALAISALLLGACSALNQAVVAPSPTASPTPIATITPSDVPAATATVLPTITPTYTLTPSPSPTLTSSPTDIATATTTLTPSITPFPAVGFVFDNWNVEEIPQNIKDGIDNPMVMFLNSNNQRTIANIATAQPNTGVQNLYLVSPANPGRRILILEVDASTRLNVYPARNGAALAYVKVDEDSRSNGLYVMDLSSGFAARVLPGDNPLVQRGFFVEPDWSPDGSQLALTVATGYDLDIFLYAKDGSGHRNITDQGSLDLWPRWSPDGRRISFVSDRADCPSWIPGDELFCDGSKMTLPRGGQVYIFNIETGQIERVSDANASEPPYWINERLLAFASGNPFDLLNPQRHLWQADIETGEIKEVRLAGSLESASYLSEAWSPDGKLVLVQIADQTNQLVLMSIDGQLLRRDNEMGFPRFAMSAAWSPDGQRIAIGGSAGQCPYGVRVKAADYRNIATGNPPPSMCDPIFSDDGQRIAFSGVNPRVDGRNDVFVANFNGFGAINLTGNLRGQVELLGWVGGSP